MTEMLTLEDVMSGETTARQAHDVISPLLSSGDEGQVRKACTALRAWTWKALNERRRDSDLRVWYNHLKGYAAFLEESDPEHSIRLSVLCELIYESVSVAEVIPVQELLKRQHPAAIMLALSNAGLDGMKRSALAEAMEMKPANLSRIVSLLVANGLIERDGFTDEVSYTISAHGQREVERILP